VVIRHHGDDLQDECMSCCEQIENVLFAYRNAALEVVGANSHIPLIGMRLFA
jgi:hypothetical protein